MSFNFIFSFVTMHIYELYGLRDVDLISFKETFLSTITSDFSRLLRIIFWYDKKN